MAQICKWVSAWNWYIFLLSVRWWHPEHKFGACYSSLWKPWILERTGGSLSGKGSPRLDWIWTRLSVVEGLICKGRDSTVPWEAETQPMGYTWLKKSWVSVWGQLLAMLWRTTCTRWFCGTATQHTRDKAASGPLGRRDPSCKNGSQIWVLAMNWRAFPLWISGVAPTGCPL